MRSERERGKERKGRERGELQLFFLELLLALYSTRRAVIVSRCSEESIFSDKEGLKTYGR